MSDQFTLLKNKEEDKLVEQLKDLKFELVLDDTIKEQTPISKLVCQTKAEYIAVKELRLRKENDELKYINPIVK